jgi:hypothetical protein
MSNILNFKNWLNESRLINEATDDATTEINGWFRKVVKDEYGGLDIYPTLAFCSYVSDGQAKINAGYYANWIKAGATEKAAEPYDILAIFRSAIRISNIPKLQTKDANSLHAAIQGQIDKKISDIINYAPMGTGMPLGKDAQAIKLLSGKKSTYPYYNYKLKKQVQGGVPCTDATYTGPGKGTLYQLALEVAAPYF